MNTQLIHHKMQLLPLILGIVLLPKACTLKCYDCVPDATQTCEDKEVTCPPSGDRCGAIRVILYVGRSKVSDVQTKGCLLAEQCTASSLNFGTSRYIISTNCCSSDLCNMNHTSEPSRPSSNAKKCYYCNGPQCSETLHCEGKEVYCVTAKVTIQSTETTMKGCASKQMCSGKTSEELQESMKGNFSCCQGDFCNSGSSTRAGLLLLVALFVSSVAFS